MAGTDRRKACAAAHVDAGAPAVILVRTQLGENIGAAARAMLNCGLSDLRLVQPRDGWPNVKALGAASGADAVLNGVQPVRHCGGGRGRPQPGPRHHGAGRASC